MTNWNIQPILGQRAINAGAGTYHIEPDSASQHTKGSWVEVVSSTPWDSSGFLLTVSSYNYHTCALLIDIGIGGSGSEVVLVSNIYHAYFPVYFTPICFDVPLTIPAGSRLAIRMQHSHATQTVVARSTLHLFNGSFNFKSAQKITTYGEVTATTKGTTIDPGGTVDTKGAWVEITSGLTHPIKALTPLIGPNADFTRSAAREDFLVDVGAGSSGNEQVIIPDLKLSAYTTNDTLLPHYHGWFNIMLDAGTRIAMRAQSNNNTVGERELDAVIYGLT